MEISSDLFFKKLITEIKSENIKSFHISVHKIHFINLLYL